MPNDVYTDYWFKGELPEEFEKLNPDMSIEEIGNLFGVELEEARWYIDDCDIIEKDYAYVRVWSAWNPIFDPWEKIAAKYNLKLTWFTSDELPYYFDSNSDDCDKYVVYYDYEDPEEWYDCNYEYYRSAKDIQDEINSNNATEFKIIPRIDPSEWYDDEELKDYIYDGIDGLNELLKEEEE
jgi:hypothetical protein